MARGKDKIMVSGGIGPSKNFGAPEETRLKGGVDRILACHIEGVPIKDLNLNPEVLSALDYYATDEGILEKNAGRAEPSGISFGKDPFDKALMERRDDVKLRDKPLFDSRDPLKELADRHAVPGMRPKFLSAAKLKERGGVGDYELVKDKDGAEVKVRGMVLAHIPEEVADARTEHYRERGNTVLRQMTEKFQAETGASAVVDAGNTTKIA
jgi:hypothetical protein